MKEYTKPIFDYIILKSEERFAAGSACQTTGSCTNEEAIGLHIATGLVVFY